MYSFNRLANLKEKYDPNHDVGPNAPVQYQTNVLIEAITDLITEVEEMKERIAKIENRDRP